VQINKHAKQPAQHIPFMGINIAKSYFLPKMLWRLLNFCGVAAKYGILPFSVHINVRGWTFQPETRTMSLFGLLNDDIFLIFSRSNRHLYAQVVRDLFITYYSDTVTFPNKTDIITSIYQTLRDHSELWTDEPEDFTDLPEIRAAGRKKFRRTATTDESQAKQDILLERAHHIYSRLLATGWLEEESYGLRVTVDMSPAALMLAERLHHIENGLTTTFGGVVITIRNALNAVISDPDGSAAGLNKAAETAVRFSRELRAVLSSLRTIEKNIMESRSLKAKLTTFFEDFIGQLVLKDFDSIYRTNHPYRFKGAILGGIERIADDDILRGHIADGYEAGQISGNHRTAIDQLNADLQTIENVFTHIDLTYERINAFRIRLEARLRNTVKYAEQGDQRFSHRLTALVARLDDIAARHSDENDAHLATASKVQKATDETTAHLRAPAPMPPSMVLYASHLMAKSRKPKPPVVAEAIRKPEKDPAVDAYRVWMRRYNAMFQVDARMVTHYVNRHMDNKAEITGSQLPIETVDDFLAFEQLRRYRHMAIPAFRAQYEFETLPGQYRHDRWLTCTDFIIRRKSQNRRVPPKTTQGKTERHSS
jgi:hypothetical protein